MGRCLLVVCSCRLIDQPGIFVPSTLLAVSSQAGSFRERVAGPETAVGTDRVVVSSPTIRHDLCFLECVEQLAVQKLLRHLAIK